MVAYHRAVGEMKKAVFRYGYAKPEYFGANSCRINADGAVRTAPAATAWRDGRRPQPCREWLRIYGGASASAAADRASGWLVRVGSGCWRQAGRRTDGSGIGWRHRHRPVRRCAPVGNRTTAVPAGRDRSEWSVQATPGAWFCAGRGGGSAPSGLPYAWSLPAGERGQGAV